MAGIATVRPNRLSLAVRTRLVEAARPLALWTAKQYRGKGLDFDELVSAAFEGLAKAARCFRFAEGYEFKTYAQWWVRQAIVRALGKNRHAGFKWVPEGFKARKRTRPVYRDDNGEPGPMLHEVLPDRGPGPQAEVAGGDQWAALMRVLPPKWRAIAEARFRYDLTLDETGDFLGLTRERVRQLEVRLLERIQRAITQGRIKGV